MELDKKKYKRADVENILADLRTEYEEKIARYKLRINELICELKSAQAELSAYKENDEKISSAIKDAEVFSISLKSKAEEKYNAEVESLRSFSYRWRTFFSALIEKYPLYGKIEDAKKTFDCISKIVSSYDGKDVVSKVDGVISEICTDKEYCFDPKSKINDYISATSDNGFNLDEVLNPGELELEDLCKELGLIDEK